MHVQHECNIFAMDRIRCCAVKLMLAYGMISLMAILVKKLSSWCELSKGKKKSKKIQAMQIL